MSILVITTGGTIGAEACYDFKYKAGFVSTMPPDGRDFVREAVEQNFAALKARVIALEPRDSKLMDDAYRHLMIKTAAVAPEAAVLITHGTDTLLRTADTFCQHRIVLPALANKIIVLTGAMIPLANGPESDGYLNLKFSLERLQRLAADKTAHNNGIYIVLCDHETPGDETSAWLPRLYPYAPGRYEKVYAEDRRFSRLRRVG